MNLTMNSTIIELSFHTEEQYVQTTVKKMKL